MARMVGKLVHTGAAGKRNQTKSPCAAQLGTAGVVQVNYLCLGLYVSFILHILDSVLDISDRY